MEQGGRWAAHEIGAHPRDRRDSDWSGRSPHCRYHPLTLDRRDTPAGSPRFSSHVLRAPALDQVRCHASRSMRQRIFPKEVPCQGLSASCDFGAIGDRFFFDTDFFAGHAAQRRGKGRGVEAATGPIRLWKRSRAMRLNKAPRLPEREDFLNGVAVLLVDDDEGAREPLTMMQALRRGGDSGGIRGRSARRPRSHESRRPHK